MDFAIMKNTKIPRWENAKLGIGLQFFNFFNHANFGFPDNFEFRRGLWPNYSTWSSPPPAFSVQQPRRMLLAA